MTRVNCTKLRQTHAKSLPEHSAQPKWTKKSKVIGFLLGLQSSAGFVHCCKIFICWEQLTSTLYWHHCHIYNHNSVWANLHYRNTWYGKAVWYLTFPIIVPNTAERMASLQNFNHSKFCIYPCHSNDPASTSTHTSTYLCIPNCTFILN